jgi:hypothetical protein
MNLVYLDGWEGDQVDMYYISISGEFRKESDAVTRPVFLTIFGIRDQGMLGCIHDPRIYRTRKVIDPKIEGERRREAGD